MKKCVYAVLLFGFFYMITVNSVWAHFGMLIPSDSMIMQGENKQISIQLSFSHPFEGIGMPLSKPKEFGLLSHKKTVSLQSRLREVKVMDHKGWQVDYGITRPGAYLFYMEPKPYWEPAEDCYIIHYTKTVIAAFQDDEGWDEEIGLKAEIIPLSKPFGLYAGNVFQGIVKVNGRAVPWAEVEVEYYNQEKTYQAPTDFMITQTIKADGNGVFTYAAPKAGWWGFAALHTSDEKLSYNNQLKDVEIGAVIWVKFFDMK